MRGFEQDQPPLYCIVLYYIDSAICRVFHFAWRRQPSQRRREFYWRNEHFLEIYLPSVMFVGTVKVGFDIEK